MPSEDLLGSFFGRRVHPNSADILGAPASQTQRAAKAWELPHLAHAAAAMATQVPLTEGTAVLKQLSRKRLRAAEEDRHCLNNIVPCPQPLQQEMVFSGPLHLGLPSPMLRDILSGARGELSSVSLEMADTDAWLFRNEVGRRRSCLAAAAAARLAHDSHDISPAAAGLTAAPQPAAASPTIRSAAKSNSCSAFAPPAESAHRHSRWGSPDRAVVSSCSHKAAHLSELAAEAACPQAFSAASAVSHDVAPEAEERSGDPLTNPCSSISSDSLSSLDSDEEATLAAAGHLLSQVDAPEGNRDPGILRRAHMLASTFLLPITMLGAYVPIGQQRSLAKPAQLRGAPGDDDDVSAEMDGSEAQLARDVSRVDALQRRLRTVFWMHRLPVYRARVREIYDSVYGKGAPAGDQPVGNNSLPFACMRNRDIFSQALLRVMTCRHAVNQGSDGFVLSGRAHRA